MEKALHITKIKNLTYFQKGSYDRIYWGAEFCQNLIPSIRETEEIVRFAKQQSLTLTFMTPFVTENGLKNLGKIFSWLRHKKINCEIVVNDWGVLEFVHRTFGKYFMLNLGRLLVRQQRDPAMKRVLEKQLPFPIKRKDGKIVIFVHQPPSRQYQQGIRATYINSSLLQNFLSTFGIRRIELNNTLQGLNLTGIRFKKSLYTPYVNICTTRFCPMESRFQKTYRINVCRRECQKYYDILRCKHIPKLIYKRGNTTFYKNSLDIKEISKSEIDRIVFQPEMPF